MLKAEIYFQPLVELTTPEETMQTVIKALHAFFDDNGLSYDYENVRHRLTSYSLWPQNKKGKKPSIDIKPEGDGYLLSITADFKPITYGYYPSFQSFAFSLYDCLDCAALIRQKLGPLRIDKERSYVTYNKSFEGEESLYYLAPYLYATPDEMQDEQTELDSYGHLYTMSEFLQEVEDGTISDYDGSCTLLRKEGDNWYASKLNLSIDYQIPDYVKTRYSHVMWYNR